MFISSFLFGLEPTRFTSSSKFYKDLHHGSFKITQKKKEPFFQRNRIDLNWGKLAARFPPFGIHFWRAPASVSSPCFFQLKWHLGMFLCSKYGVCEKNYFHYLFLLEKKKAYIKIRSYRCPFLISGDQQDQPTLFLSTISIARRLRVDLGPSEAPFPSVRQSSGRIPISQWRPGWDGFFVPGLIDREIPLKLTWGFPKMVVFPKSSILMGFSIINHPFWGTPIFRNTHTIAENRPKPKRKQTRIPTIHFQVRTARQIKNAGLSFCFVFGVFIYGFGPMGFITMKNNHLGKYFLFFPSTQSRSKEMLNTTNTKRWFNFLFSGFPPKCFEQKGYPSFNFKQKNCWRVVVFLLNLKIGSLIPKNKKKDWNFSFSQRKQGCPFPLASPCMHVMQLQPSCG